MTSSAAAQIIAAMDSQTAAFAEDVLDGLAAAPKTLPSRWLYDDHGSALFERITQLPEYYPTRTETAILHQHADAIASFCGPNATIVEYGAGASVKSQILLEALRQPRMYVAIDIAGDFLATSAARLRKRFPALDVLPYAADFTQDFDLPSTVADHHSRTGLFLGSTIGNLHHDEAIRFLKRVRRHLVSGPGPEESPAHNGRALIGIDLKKSTDILVPAYDDAAGVTAAFNLNLLTRMNRELGGSFDLERFQHEARWNTTESAIEMHLVSTSDQTIIVAERAFDFAAGETIHTESSRKYALTDFDTLAKEAGWQIAETWQDDKGLFALVGLEPHV